LREARRGERGNRKPRGHLFVHTNHALISLQTPPRVGNAAACKIVRLRVLHCCKPASRVSWERLQNCHPRAKHVKSPPVLEAFVATRARRPLGATRDEQSGQRSEIRS
jgi:hypothetical protein